MSKADGVNEAVRLATEALRGIDFDARCRLHGLRPPQDGVVPLRAFGKDWGLNHSSFQMSDPQGKPAKPADLLLILHFLQCDFPVPATGTLATFRDFPGGAFYLEPFLSRTVKPLLQRFGDDVDGLRANLSRFDWSPSPLGDFGAVVKTFGPLDLTLVHRRGDEEFGPSIEVFFDSCVRRVFQAEDAAALASRICIGLL